MFSYILSRTMQGSYWYRRSPYPKRCACLPLQVTTLDMAQIAGGSTWLLVAVGLVPGVPREITLDNGCK